MSLLNQMLRDLEHNKTTTTSPLTPENSIHVSPSASKENINKALIVGALISSIAVFFAYLALSKAKQPVTIISQPLAIPALKTAPKQVVNEPLVAIKNANIEVNLETALVIASSAKTKSKLVTKPLKNTLKKPSSITAPVIIAPKQIQNSIKSVPLSSNQQAEALYQQASKANNIQHAIGLLKQSLTLTPKKSNARLLLTRLLINAGEKQSATDLLDESLIIFPQDSAFIMARAQLYLQEKNSESALQLLTQTTIPPKNEAYLALLAAAYQQHKSYTQSNIHYQTLVQLNANKAEYWLGLALAQDALNQKKAAYNTYQHALNLHSLNPTVTDYIQQRLQQLP